MKTIKKVFILFLALAMTAALAFTVLAEPAPEAETEAAIDTANTEGESPEGESAEGESEEGESEAGESEEGESEGDSDSSSGENAGPPIEELIGDASVESISVSIPEDFVIYNRMDMSVVPETVTAKLSDGSDLDVTDYVTYTGDLSQPGEVTMTAGITVNEVPVETTFTVTSVESLFVSDAVPAEFQEEAEQKGTVEHLEYETWLYEEDGAPTEAAVNECYVYLPYGYDESKEYNILYLMHGGGESAGYWFNVGPYAEIDDGDSPGVFENITLNVLDQLIAQGYCDPVIVVTPCIKSSIEAGVNSTSTFRYELRNELIPLVEGKYATYAHGDTSPESLTASRDHRAYAGLSMGSITGWSSILMGCLDYIAYVGNFSGCKSEIPPIADAINTTYAKFPILFFYNGNGTWDMSHDEHVEAYAEVLSLCPDRLKDGEDLANGCNSIFVDKPGFGHAYDSWIIDLYNILTVFFKLQ